jgi:bifunctional non-homologous end joining protein LigD
VDAKDACSAPFLDQIPAQRKLLQLEVPISSKEARRVAIKAFIVDGEIVALDEQGRHSFGSVQKINISKAPLRFYLFDLLHFDNADLTKNILKKRRTRLEAEFLALAENVQLSPILSGEAHEVLASVKRFEFEGVVAKRIDSVYLPGETSGNWQKHKRQRSDDFLIGGYIPGSYGIEQLAVGEKRDGHFYFVESVKNGFVRSTRQRVFDAIKHGEIKKCPFVNLPEKQGAHRMDRKKMATVRWAQPRIVAEIAFNERTTGGICVMPNFFACATLKICARKEVHRYCGG